MYKLFNHSAETASSLSSTVYSTYTNTSTAVSSRLNSGYSNVSRSISDNYTHVSGKVLDSYDKLSKTYPYLNTLTDTTNSIGTTFKSYTDMFEPVSSEEREIPRTHPNDNLGDNVTKLGTERIEIVSHVLDLYSLKPSSECFKHYDENVIFHDPIVYTTGLANLKSQFYGLPKIFVRSTTVDYKIIENNIGTIKIGLNQKYELPLVGYAVVQNSIIILEINENHVITKHVDYWSGRPVSDEGGILRKGVAKVVSALVRVPQES